MLTYLADAEQWLSTTSKVLESVAYAHSGHSPPRTVGCAWISQNVYKIKVPEISVTYCRKSFYWYVETSNGMAIHTIAKR